MFIIGFEIRNFAQVASLIYHLLKKNTLFIWEKKQAEAMDLLKLAFITLLVLVSLDYLRRVGEIIFAVDTSLKE